MDVVKKKENTLDSSLPSPPPKVRPHISPEPEYKARNTDSPRNPAPLDCLHHPTTYDGQEEGQCATVSERTTPLPVRTTHASLYAVHAVCSFSVQNIFCCCYFVVCGDKKCTVLY